MIPFVHIGSMAEANVLQSLFNTVLETVLAGDRYRVVLSPDVDIRNRRYNGCGPCAKDLRQRTGGNSFLQLFHTHFPFFYRKSHVLCEDKNGVARHAIEDGRRKPRSYQLSFEYKHNIHHPPSVN